MRKLSPKVGLGTGIERGAAAVEHGQHALAAAIGNLVKDGAVAAARIARLKHIEVGRELDQALSVARRLVDVADDLVRGQVRIDGEEYFADHALVWPRGAERFSAEHVGAIRNLHAQNGRRPQLRETKRQKAEILEHDDYLTISFR